MRKTLTFLLLLASLAMVACGAPLDREATIGLDLGSDTSALEGVSLSAAGTLWVLTQERLHELSLDGEALRTVELDALQPAGDRYRDVLDLGDGTFAASFTLAVARLYPDEGYAEDYFCLEPGSFEPMPVEPTEPDPQPSDPGILGRVNPTLSADFESGRIYATPRTFQDGALVDNKLVEYTIAEGAFLRALELGELRPEALAVQGDTAVLLEQGRLIRADISGRALEILEELDLDGVERAVGAAFDGDRLLVLDEGAREIAVFRD